MDSAALGCSQLLYLLMQWIEKARAIAKAGWGPGGEAREASQSKNRETVAIFEKSGVISLRKIYWLSLNVPCS